MSRSLRRLVAIMLPLLSILLLLVFLVLVGNFMIRTLSPNQIHSFQQWTASFAYYAQFVRWLLYALLWIYWAPLIRTLGRLRHWDQHVIDRALQSKFSSVGLLLLVEIFIIQRLHIHLIQLFEG